MSDDGCDHDRIFERIASGDASDRRDALLEAWSDPHADMLLASMLDAARDADLAKLHFAVLLGDSTGEAGTAALKRAVDASGPGTQDLRCTALLALAKRCGEAATPVLLAALSQRNAAVKDYAVIGLAGTGDDRAWDEVLRQLPRTMRRKHPTHIESIAYLAQHLDDPARRRTLVRFVRANWTAIAAEEWFTQYWPDARPDGPPTESVLAPDAAAIRASARDPLFRPFGPPRPFWS